MHVTESRRDKEEKRWGGRLSGRDEHGEEARESGMSMRWVGRNTLGEKAGPYEEGELGCGDSPN